MKPFALKLKGLFVSVKTPRKQSSEPMSPISVEKSFQTIPCIFYGEPSKSSQNFKLKNDKILSFAQTFKHFFFLQFTRKPEDSNYLHTVFLYI